MLSRLTHRGSATTSDDDKKEKTEPLKKVHNRSVPRERLSRDRSRESDRSSLGLTRLYLPRDHSCERSHLYQIHDRSRDDHHGDRGGHSRERGHRDKHRSHGTHAPAAVPTSTEKVDMPKEFLERRVEELNRQLHDEKQHNRRDKLTVARLQRELARSKSEGPVRESLMRDLERERMLRIDAEHRLHDMTIDSDNCKSRLQALQQDFKKMEEMVRGMMQYKGKIDVLKQEKSNLTITYETSMKKYHSHISNLEHENKVLLAEIKKLETLPNNRTDEADKSKLLLERLKRLETENSSLVLENEQQRQQYEKCLDDIANQVVQALMTQKSLREECMKLQKRVLDLEQQNRELNVMFQQRMRFTSDSLLQSITNRKLQHAHSASDGHHMTGTEGASCHGGGADVGSFHSLPAASQPQRWFQTSRTPPYCPTKLSPRPATGAPETAYLDASFESLQSMFSDYNENTQFDDSMGKPQLSSPPPWLRDKLFQASASLATEDESLSSGSHFNSNCTLDGKQYNNATGNNDTARQLKQSQQSGSGSKNQYQQHQQQQQQHVQTRIETEFPASNHSPKVTYNSRVVGSEVRSEVTNNAKVDQNTSVKGQADSRLSNNNDYHDTQNNESPVVEDCTHEGIAELSKMPSSANNSNLKTSSGEKETSESDISPGRELLKLSDSFSETYMVNDVGDGLPMIQNKLFDDTDDDDDGSVSSPRSKHISVASTVSLNELLERGLDEMETPVDDQFEMDNMPFFQTQESKLEYLGGDMMESSDLSDADETGPNQIKPVVQNIDSNNYMNNSSSQQMNQVPTSNCSEVMLQNSNNNNNSSVPWTPSSIHSQLLQRPSSLNINHASSTDNTRRCSNCVLNSVDDGSPTPTNSSVTSSATVCSHNATSSSLSSLHNSQPLHNNTNSVHNSTSSLSHNQSSVDDDDDDVFPLFKKPLPPKLPPRRAPPKPPKPPALPPKTSHRSFELFDDNGPPPPLPPRQDSKRDLYSNRQCLSRGLSAVPPPPPPRPHRSNKDSNKDSKGRPPQGHEGKVKVSCAENSSVTAVTTTETTSSGSSACDSKASTTSVPGAASSGGEKNNKTGGGTGGENSAASSSLSPDSAMQQSFSSTCSNGSDILSDTKPISSSRDDGYSSLSSDVQPEVMEKFAFIKKIPKLGFQRPSAMAAVCVEGASCGGVEVRGHGTEAQAAHYDSISSNNSSVEQLPVRSVCNTEAMCSVKSKAGDYHTLPKCKPCLIRYVTDNVADTRCQHPPQALTQECSTRSCDTLYSTLYMDIHDKVTPLSPRRHKSDSNSLPRFALQQATANSFDVSWQHNSRSEPCSTSPPKPAKRHRIKTAVSSCGSSQSTRAHTRVCISPDGANMLLRSASEGYINSLHSDSDSDTACGDDDIMSTASLTRGQHQKHSRKDGISNVRLIRRRRTTSREASPQANTKSTKGRSPASGSSRKTPDKSVDATSNPNKSLDLHSFLSSESDSDLEDAVGVNFVELWRQRESPALKLPEWRPKLVAHELKKNLIQSPLATRKLDSSSSSEQWLLKFSKSDISHHLHKTGSMPSSPRTNHVTDGSPRQSSPRRPPPPPPKPRNHHNMCLDGSYNQHCNEAHLVSGSTPETKLTRKPSNHDSDSSNSCERSANQNGVYPCPRSPFMGMSSVHRRRASDSDKIVTVDGNGFQIRTSPPLPRGQSGDSRSPYHMTGQGSLIHTSPHHHHHHHHHQRKTYSASSTANGINKHTCQDQSHTDRCNNDFGDFTHQSGDFSQTVDGFHRSLSSLNSLDYEGDEAMCSADVFMRRDISGFGEARCTTHPGGESCNQSNAGSEFYTWLDESLELPVTDATNDSDKRLLSHNDVDNSTIISSDTMEEDIIQPHLDTDKHQDVSVPETQNADEESAVNAEEAGVDDDDEEVDAQKRADLLDALIGCENNEPVIENQNDIAAKVNSRKGKNDAVRLSISPRKTLNYETFFKRFGDEEEQAISKFSFLDTMSSTSQSADEDEPKKHSPVKEADLNDVQTAISLENGDETDKIDSDDVNGAVDYAGDMMRALRLHPPKNRTLEALKEEARLSENNRLSSTTFDRTTFGEDGISLSDSCCESFSSSNMSVNDITIL